jgi:hypothetical protein
MSSLRITPLKLTRHGHNNKPPASLTHVALIVDRQPVSGNATR